MNTYRHPLAGRRLTQTEILEAIARKAAPTRPSTKQRQAELWLECFLARGEFEATVARFKDDDDG